MVDLMLRCRNILKTSLLVSALGLMALPIAMAQDAPKEDKIIAIVNGHEIKVRRSGRIG